MRRRRFRMRRRYGHAAARGLKALPPMGSKVRLTGYFLKSTGQQRGVEGSKRFTVIGHSGSDWVVVDEEAFEWQTMFTPAELAADPSLKWRRINKGNLEIVGASPKAADYP